MNTRLTDLLKLLSSMPPELVTEGGYCSGDDSIVNVVLRKKEKGVNEDDFVYLV